MFNIFFQQSEKGVTMVELLVAIAIFATLMMVLVSFFIGYHNSFTYLQATVDASESTGLFISFASNAVRQASRIVTSHSFSGITYTTGTTTLVLELPSIDSNKNVIPATYDYMVFYLSDGDIYWISQGDGASARSSFTRKISNSVQSLTFTYDNSDVTYATQVDIAVIVQKSLQGNIIESSLQQQVYLRNK